jgi:hypothetical protein
MVLTKPFPVILDGLFVSTLLLLAGAMGSKVLKAFGIESRALTPAERLAICGALGLGLLQYLFLGLGALHVLSNLSVGLALLLLLALFGRTVTMVCRDLVSCLLRLRPATWEPMAKVLTVAICVTLCFALLNAATPITDADGTGYHIPIVKWWVEARTLTALPIVNSYWPMGGEAVMGLGFAAWSETSVKVIHWAYGVLALVALYAAGRRLTDDIGGLVAAGIFLTLALPEYSWAYIELGVALYVATATLSLIQWYRCKELCWLRLATLCAGFAGTFKLSFLLFGATLITLSIPELSRRGSTRNMLTEIVQLSALASLPILPWLIRSWILTGNPVYPFLHAVFPTPGWSPETSWAFQEYFRYYNWGITHPEWSHELRQMIRLGALALMLGLTGWSAFSIRDECQRGLVLLLGVAILISIWSLGLNVRYTLPLWPLLLLCALSLTAALWGRRLVRVTVPALVALALITTVLGWAPIPIDGFNRRRDVFADIRDSLAFQVGSLSRTDYLRKRGFNVDMVAVARREVPDEALGIIYPGTGGYYYNFKYLFSSPTHQGLIRFDTWENFNNDIDAMNVRYFICNEEIRLQALLPIYPASLNEQAFLRRLVRERAEKVAVANGEALWRILPRT